VLMTPRTFFLFTLFVFAIAQNCTNYCQNINLLCNGTNTQFYGPSDCALICPTYPLNATTDVYNNSYECRLYHLNNVINGMSPVIHCPHAGPTGGLLCGTACNYYCDFHLQTCTGANQYFSNKADCLAECMAYPDSANPTNLYDIVGSGDSWDCRAYHLNVAASNVGKDSNAVAAHCAHSSQSGADTCGDYCMNYCDDMAYYCTGTNSQFNSPHDCLDACAKYPRNSTGTLQNPIVGGNSFECRKYHVMAGALANQEDIHCVHAGPSGGGVCSGASRNAQLGTVGLVLSLLWLFL